MTTDDRLARIEHDIAELRDILTSALKASAAPSPLDVLTLDEAARYIGVASYTLRTGKAGTRSIPRHTSRPVQFLRASLDQWKRGAHERELRKLQPKAERGPRGLVRRRPAA